MAEKFFTELFESIFTPGPTPVLLAATNATFAALQVVLLALLLATYSVHFLVLSFLCGGLWASINWFAKEIIKAGEEMEGEKEKQARRNLLGSGGDDSGTETEEVGGGKQAKADTSVRASGNDRLKVKDAATKRMSAGEVSGTDSEWDKVESEVEVEG